MKAGFKQTDVGVIPEEWHVSSLGMHGTTYGGLTGKTKRDFGLGAARYVTFMNVMSNVVINCDIFERVRVEASESQNPVRLNDLLFNGSSESPEEVAFCAVVPQEVAGLYLNSFCFGYRLQHGALVSPLFLAYLCRSQVGRQLVKPLAQGSTRYNISKGALLGVSLALPPFPEQRAIAEALSDVDGLLSGLDRLIAKKRDLKQATMQQLLTGQTRLPTFEGEWAARKFGSLVQQVFPKSTISSGDGLEHGTYPLFVSGGEPKRTEVAQFRDNVALVFSDGGTFAVRYAKGNFSVTDHCYALKLNSSLADMRWVEAWFSLNAQQMDRLTFKGSGLRNLDKSSLRNIEIRCPEPGEQAAIADALKDLGAELDVLEARREKTQALKQGMMQELLTGRIRLLQPEALNA